MTTVIVTTTNTDQETISIETPPILTTTDQRENLTNASITNHPGAMIQSAKDLTNEKRVWIGERDLTITNRLPHRGVRRERGRMMRERREKGVERENARRERETVDEDCLERKKRKERGGSEDRAVVEKEKRSRRRFGEKVKEEDNRTDNNDNGNSFENVKRVDSSEAGVKEEVNDEPLGGGRGSTTENGGV